MAMRKQAGLFVLVVALLLPLAASAAPAHHDSFDVTGTVFPCPTHTYTITSGTLKIVTHTTETASGNTHFTATTTPNHVSLLDARTEPSTHSAARSGSPVTARRNS
jgi:hypothetical protein